jgi:CDP-glycerol glycerophosphotransferase (TagB/SpsB family)
MIISFKKRIYRIIIFIISIYSKIFLNNNKYDRTIVIFDFVNENYQAMKIIDEVSSDSIVFTNQKSKQKINGIIPIKIKSNSILFLFKVIPFLTKSNLVICDNYFPFLAGYIKPTKQKLIQIWHADGAIKNFGLKSKEINSKTNFEIANYQNIYSKFDKYICSSDEMGEAFVSNYGVDHSKIKIIGSLKSEYLLSMKEKNKTKIIDENKFLQNKKILMYAPTFRPYQYDYKKVIEKIYSEFGKDYIIIIKYHPKIKNKYCENFFNYKIDELISITDLFITDYSSTFFKYNSVNKNGMTFLFWDDFDRYSKKISINEKFLEDNIFRACSCISQIRQKIKEVDLINEMKAKNNSENVESVKKNFIKEILN